ncbi:zinc dependent phospholipase C family protein [Geodermatophilus sp. SYSU D00867]
MPKYGVHHVVLTQAVESLLTAPEGTAAHARGKLLKEQRFAADLGAIGPDLFFFGGDYPALRLLAPLHTAYLRLRRGFAAAMEPIEEVLEPLGQVVDETIDALTEIPGLGPIVEFARQVSAETQEIETLLDELLDTAVGASVVGVAGLAGGDGIEFFRGTYQDIFQPPLQAGMEEPDWFWFDMLHYRRPSAFARALLDRAEEKEGPVRAKLRAYALAYLSHISTDVVGHPYVNVLCHAPFRIGVQRHVVVENFIDQWVWQRRFPGESVRTHLWEHLSFKDHESLDDDIADLICAALRDTYADIAHPEVPEGMPGRDYVKTCYDVLRTAMSYLGDNEDLRPREPYVGANDDLADLADFLATFIPPSPPPAPIVIDAPEAVNQFMTNYLTAVNWLRDVVKSLLTTVRLDPESPGDLAVRQVLLMLYACQCALYQIYRWFQEALALAGLQYPEPETARLRGEAGVVTAGIAEQLLVPAAAREGIERGYPALRPPDQDHMRFPACRIPPPETGPIGRTACETSRCTELPETTAAPYPLTDRTTPEVFLSELPFRPDILERYASATSPEATEKLVKRHGAFGNAVDFTAWLIEHAGDPRHDLVTLCDWNLDADRGYAAKCWTGFPPVCSNGAVTFGLKHGRDTYLSVFPQVLPDATGVPVADGGPSLTAPDRRIAQCLLTSLNHREDAIPPRLANCLNPPPDQAPPDLAEWLLAVPERLVIEADDPEVLRCFYVNGINTDHYSAIFEVARIRDMLFTPAQRVGYADVSVELIHNRRFFLDVLFEWVVDKVTGEALSRGLRPAFANPATIGVIAALHTAMQANTPLLLIGYSQGTLITANAVLAFTAMSNDRLSYCQNNVRVAHLARLISQDVTTAVQQRVRAYGHLNIAGDAVVLAVTQDAEAAGELTTEDLERLAGPIASYEQARAAFEVLQRTLAGTALGDLLQQAAADPVSSGLHNHASALHFQEVRDQLTRGAGDARRVYLGRS